MNDDDIKLLSMLLRYSQRRMVVFLGLVQAHFIGDADVARAAVERLAHQGLVYMQGVTVRLSLPGFAHAVRLSASEGASRRASVHPLGKRAQTVGSRAA